MVVSLGVPIFRVFTVYQDGRGTENGRVASPGSVPIHLKGFSIFSYCPNTVKTLNIGTPRPATVVVLNIKQFNFTLK